MATPFWGVSVAYWLHMLATVVWVGGLAALALLVLPSASRALDSSAFAALLSEIQRRLDALGWFSLLILVGTGMVQMSANPNYSGFLAIDNLWAGAILAKHLVIFVMIGNSALLTWGVLPGLRRAVFRMARSQEGSAKADLESLQKATRASVRLTRLSLVLAVVVLGLTAVARAV